MADIPHGIGVAAPLTSLDAGNMSLIVLIIVLLAHAAVVVAGQLQSQGFVFADQICADAFGLCQQPFLLGISAGLICTAYFLVHIFHNANRK